MTLNPLGLRAMPDDWPTPLQKTEHELLLALSLLRRTIRFVRTDVPQGTDFRKDTNRLRHDIRELLKRHGIETDESDKPDKVPAMGVR